MTQSKAENKGFTKVKRKNKPKGGLDTATLVLKVQTMNEDFTKGLNECPRPPTIKGLGEGGGSRKETGGTGRGEGWGEEQGGGGWSGFHVQREHREDRDRNAGDVRNLFPILRLRVRSGSSQAGNNGNE